MDKSDKCGIYKITCQSNGRIYVGSSKQIYTRWTQHRRSLRGGKSNCRYLQHAWTKYKEESFYFSIIEECLPDDLESREQFYIDTLRPDFNSITDVKRRSGPEQRAKIAAAARLRSDLLTHCPKGHLYDDANTYVGKRSKHICKTCNAERVSRLYNALTPEEHKAAIQYRRESHKKNRTKRLEGQRVYVAEHKAEKRAYDRLHRAEANRRTSERRKNETPEQREDRLARKRASYLRCKKDRDQPAP